MIYIFIGNDLKNKNIEKKRIAKNSEICFIQPKTEDKNIIMSYSSNNSLFGSNPVIIMENILTEGNICFNKLELNLLRDSKTIFIFNEDKLLAAEQNKYKKYAEIRIYKSKKTIEKKDFNIFSISDAFSSKNKIKAWSSYNQSIIYGIEPEAVAGVLFWKIKNMILKGSKFFSKKELKEQSGKVVYLYHMAHRGEVDFSIGLEQFILNSLSSK